MIAEEAVGLRAGPVEEARASALLFYMPFGMDTRYGHAWLSCAVYNRTAIVIMRRA